MTATALTQLIKITATVLPFF